jgi:hypothetical protein
MGLVMAAARSPPREACLAAERAYHEPMSGMTLALYRENMIVLMVLQALENVLTSNVKTLTLEFRLDDVVAHFVLRQESPEDEEEILKNLTTEVSALTLGLAGVGEVVVRPRVAMAADHPPRYLPPGRVVFRFRD